MKLLLLGYSDIARRRVIPALNNVKRIHSICIATESRFSELKRDRLNATVYQDYLTALSSSKPDLVYISLQNSVHAEWVKTSLEYGAHVIVDKPAFTKLSDATELVDLARQRGLCLSEALVYAYHPQIQAIKSCFARANSFIKKMSATFSFPPLPKNNFRYSPALGGGALFDLGPYATSLGRLFFNSPPLHLSCQTCFDQIHNQVETGFSFTADYTDDKLIGGNFNFTGKYTNRIKVSGPNLAIDVDRVFTTPPDYKNILNLHQHGGRTTLVVPPADSFEIFLNHVIDAIVDSQHETLLNDLLTDAKAREQLSNCNCRVTTL